MKTLLESTATAATTPERMVPASAAAAAGRTAADIDDALEAADLSCHFGALLLRGGVYTGLAVVADGYDFGPHLLAGVLFGDFSAYAATALRTFRSAPVAAGCELLLFTAMFALWSWHYAFPQAGQFRALFVLGGFGAMVVRLAVALGRRQRSIYD